MNQEFLLLWGGADIQPSIYGEEPHMYGGPYQPQRDSVEIAQYENAVARGIPIIGVCRGAQLCCALNGGKLWQHSEGHNNSAHGLILKDGSVIHSAAADHHQIMIPTGDCEVIAKSAIPARVFGLDGFSGVIQHPPEIVYWPKTKTLAIQPHPEWETDDASPFKAYVNKLIFELFNLEGVF